MNKKQKTELLELLAEQETIARKIGALEEQERIIKLLREKGSHEYHDGYEEITCDTCHSIALIKGENK